jgi:hypothetical protein
MSEAKADLEIALKMNPNDLILKEELRYVEE